MREMIPMANVDLPWFAQDNQRPKSQFIGMASHFFPIASVEPSSADPIIGSYMMWLIMFISWILGNHEFRKWLSMLSNKLTPAVESRKEFLTPKFIGYSLYLWELSKTPSRTNLWRLLGKVTRSRLCLTFRLQATISKPMPTPKAMLSWDESPTVKLCSPFGKLTRSKLWLNCKPKVKLRRPLGKLTRSRLWLK